MPTTRTWTVRAALAIALVPVALLPAQPAAAVPHCTQRVYRLNVIFPAAASGSLDCVMGQGSVSDAVRALQSNLNLCYDAGLRVDGNFGTRTKSALKRAQDAAGVEDDGVYGPVTRRAIKWFRDNGAGCVRIG